MNFISVKYFNNKKEEKEILINLDNIVYLSGYIYDTFYYMNGLPPIMATDYMTQEQFSDFEKKLGMKIPITKR